MNYLTCINGIEKHEEGRLIVTTVIVEIFKFIKLRTADTTPEPQHIQLFRVRYLFSVVVFSRKLSILWDIEQPEACQHRGKCNI